MRTNEFKALYKAIATANEEQTAYIQSCGYYFINLTERQVAKVKELLIQLGNETEADGSLKWGSFIFK